jgi:hypothetical protein
MKKPMESTGRDGSRKSSALEWRKNYSHCDRRNKLIAWHLMNYSF